MTADQHASDGEAVEFVLKTDQAPEFWQFLNGLRGDDLLVELIVNELDAHSSQTDIRFEPDRLVCTGNGHPIDAGGWGRLSFIKGAGHLVAAKVGLLGVKNHGLKACFTIGNTIRLRSDGQQILQTLFAHGPDKPPFPGAMERPSPDGEAPATGTRIEVGYRRAAFTIPYGEQIPFAAIDDARIEALFSEAVATLPRRLLGIMRPGVLDDYSLTLSHHRLGTHRFVFSAGRIKRDAKLLTFFRECRDTANGVDLLLAREHACLAVSALRSATKPRFFQASAYKIGRNRLFARDGLVVEIAWDVDAKGKPRPGPGRLRYPVGYAGSDPKAASGTGCYYSGPFISDTERHELADQSSNANDEIIAACDALLAQALGTILVPRGGAKALGLIGGLNGDRLVTLANRLLQAHALPAVDRRGKTVRHKRGTLLVIPCYDHARSTWNPLLAAVAPDNLPILDPHTPASLVALLSSKACDGWEETHLRFDGKDVLDRLEQVDARYFPWRSDAEWRRTLGDPGAARAQLDALLPFLDAFDTAAARPAVTNVHLPDGDGGIHPLAALKKGAAIPRALLDLDVPPVVHPLVGAHPVFKLPAWKLDTYGLRDLLRDGRLENKSAVLRRRLFGWIAANPEALGRDDWPAVKALPIWPAVDGGLYPFDELCLPEGKIATALGAAIAKPAREVRTLCSRLKSRKARLVVRDEPTAEEIREFYTGGIAPYWRGATLTQEQRSAFHAFERVLLVLARDKSIAAQLRGLREEAIAIAQDGVVRLASTLVRETTEAAKLVLQPKDLLDRPELELDAILPPARRPSARMTLDALRDDTANDPALLPRLAVITATSDPETLAELKALPCLPHHGKLVAPEALAFKGNQGDYWGGWKELIGAGGLSDDAQALYRAAGVIRSFPDPETSRAYFAWLNQQPAATLAAQLSGVMRHILHHKGVASWLFVPPEIPCVPIMEEGTVRLLTLSEARRVAVVNDLPGLGAAILADPPNAKLRLAVSSVKSPNEPIDDTLREWDIPALSAVAGDAGAPAGTAIEPASPHFFDTVRGLAGNSAARRFRKQLGAVGVQQNQIELRFQHKLFAIQRVMVATGLSVQYRVRGRPYRTNRSWAVLADEIWLDRAGDLDALLMEAIADIVFKSPRLPYLGIVLKSALSQRPQDFEPEFRQAEPDEYEEGSGDEDVTESAQPHPGADPDPKRNTPNPGQLYGGGEVRIVTRGPSISRPQVVTEEIQRKQLKTDTYAAHCQMDLARLPPKELAAAGSYAQHFENRIWMMQAHHPDKVSASGARHAGNMLILSKVNHERIGTRLSRGDITEALRKRWVPHKIMNPDGSLWLDGGIATAIDKVTGDTIPIYFDTWHRDYWLEMAPA